MQRPHDNKCGIPLRCGLLALAVASCFAGSGAHANPTGPVLKGGHATFVTQGNTLTVTNAPGTIINWQGFSIAGSEITRFIQQSQSSSVLNRVVGINPSAILGKLQSNGRVFLINPNGITIGPGASIDVAGFLASTLNISDGDFLAGRMRFTQTPDAGSVVNQGTITTATGGMVYLVGQDVQNSGIIRSPQGEILLAAGKSIELVDAQTPEVRVQVTASDNESLNLGQLIAAGGRIGMYGALVRHSGVADANTAVLGENGKIVFKATKDVTLDAGSLTTANGAQGGSVMAHAESGTLLVSGAIEAKAASGTGGTVQMLGQNVGLLGHARVNVSGESGGGTALVGGDYQGGSPDVPNALRTYVGSDTRIAADAGSTGHGGKVVIWADGDTRFYGQVTARGGAQSGNGGFVEVSGKEILNFNGRVDVGSPSGLAGTILLDPRDITIVDLGSTPSDPQVSDSAVLFADGATNADYTISDEALEALTGNVVLQATRDITINPGLSGDLFLNNQTSGERVVFQAGRHVTVGSEIRTNGAAIWLEADSPHSNGYPATASSSGADGAGAVKINAAVQSFGADGTTTSANGGKITMIGGINAKGGTNGGGFELNADVNAGAGGIDVTLSTEATGQLNFLIGSSGQAQFTTSDTGKLKSAGQLKIGEGTTAGADGLGANANTIKVDQLAIGVTAGGPVTLENTAGTSLVLTSGDGGILVDRDLSTSQSTSISTTGALTINAPLTTNGSALNITAASISGVDYISNTGTITCTGTGCPGATVIHWDGGGDKTSWFDQLNWVGDLVPSSSNAVEIHPVTGTSVILISGNIASAKSLIADVPLTISGTGSLNLDEASQFTKGFNLSGTLLGTGVVAVNGSTGVLTWGSGSMATGGKFTLGVGSTGTLSGTLNLDRAFHNSAALTLSGATIGSSLGGGSLTNADTITAASGTLNTINANVAFSNPANSLIQVLGSLTAANFPSNGGQISVGNGGTFSTGGATLANSATSSITIDGGNFTANGVSVATGGGNMAVDGALTAGKITLLASGGSVTLNAGSTVTASGSDDTIVISGASFINNAGSATLDPGAGRFLVWSANANPFGGGTPDNRGSLAFDFKQYNATYGSTAVLGTGNGFLYMLAPTIMPVLQGTVTKTYDGLTAATLAAGNFKTTGIGEVDGDTIVLSNPAAGTYASAHAGSGILVTANSASSISSATNGAATVFGYQVSGTPASGTVGTVDPRLITVKAADQGRAYGDANPTTGSFTLTAGNLVNGDAIGSVAVSSAALVTSAAGTTHTLVNNGSNFTTGVASNYAITAQDGTLSIDPRLINLAGSRAYDGSTSFGAVAFGTISGVNGETLTVASGAGSVASATVSAGTQTLLPGSLVLGNGSGMASNYTLAGGTHTGTILPDPGNFQWVAGSGGNWDLGTNWNQGIAPVAGAMVTIPDIGAPGLSENITYRSASGSSNVKSLMSFEGLTVSGGTLNLGATSADVSVVPEITLAGGALGGAGMLNLTALNVLAGGVLKGTGTIVGNVFNTAGMVAPGASAGTLTINGNYVQGPSGLLAIEIGGLLPGSQYDQLIVTGNTTLAGGLDIQLVGGFVPVADNTFSILQGGGGITGTFATASLPVTPLMSLGYLASAVNVAAGSSVNTEQLVALQVNQTNNAPPTSDVALGTGAASTADGLLANGVYLETSGGEIVQLAVIPVAQPGTYTNIATGETTFVDAGSLPDPGVYLSADKRTVIVVILDQETGKLMVMAGSAEQSNLVVGGGAQVKKPGVCS